MLRTAIMCVTSIVISVMGPAGVYASDVIQFVEEKPQETGIEITKDKPVEADEDIFTVYTEPEDFSAVRDELEKLGYVFASAELEMVPTTYTKLEDEDTAVKMQKMLDMFEDNDDIQNVWHNWEE